MNNNTSKSSKKYFIEQLDHFASILLCVIGIPQFLYFVFWYTKRMDVLIDGQNGKICSYICLVISIFAFYSSVRLMAKYNSRLREEYLSDENILSFTEKVLFLLKQSSFWLKAAIFGMLYLLLPFQWTSAYFTIIVENSSDFIVKLKVLAILFPLLFIIDIIAHLSAIKFWSTHNEFKYEEEIFDQEFSKLIKVYMFGGAALYVLLPLVVMLLPIFKEIISFLLSPVPFVVIVLLIVVPIAVRIIHALIKRRKMIEDLLRICREKGYPEPQINRPYLSILKTTAKENFTVDVGNARYSCKMISARNKRIPLVIRDNGYYQFVHRIRLFKVEMFSFVNSYHYDYESEKNKVLIINPCSDRVLTYHGKKNNRNR